MLCIARLTVGDFIVIFYDAANWFIKRKAFIAIWQKRCTIYIPTKVAAYLAVHCAGTAAAPFYPFFTFFSRYFLLLRLFFMTASRSWNWSYCDKDEDEKQRPVLCAGEFCVYLLMQHSHTPARKETEREGSIYIHTHTAEASAAAKMHCQKLGRSSSSISSSSSSSCCCCCWLLQRGMQNSSSHQILTTSCTRYAAATPPHHTHTHTEKGAQLTGDFLVAILCVESFCFASVGLRLLLLLLLQLQFATLLSRPV